MQSARSRIEARAFPLQADREKFEKFFVGLVAARDGMLGHANGGKFGIAVTPQITTLGAHRNALKGIDFEFFYTVIEYLMHSIEAEWPR